MMSDNKINSGKQNKRDFTASQDIVENVPVETQNNADFQQLLINQIQYGEQLIENHPIEKAMEYFELLDALNPGNARILNNIGVLKHTSGDINSAIEYLLLSLKYNPCSLDTAINLIDLLMDGNKPYEALTVATDFVSRVSNPHKQQMMELIRLRFDPKQISDINEFL